MFNFMDTFITQNRAKTFAKYSLGLIFLWFGMMNLLGPGAQILEGWISNHALLSNSSETLKNAPQFLGFWQIIAAALLIAPSPHEIQRATAGILILVLSDFSLLLFFTNPVWIEALGGFPAIGSGQGLLKYVTLGGLGLYFSAPLLTKFLKLPEKEIKDISLVVMLIGICLVLLWIGGMKFTEIEARGIEPLLKTSPFFSWIPATMGLMGSSYFIGVIELVTLALLLFYWKSRTLFLLGGILCIITFLGTLSFMLTFPGWSQEGFPYIGGTGHFLIKDLGLLAATFLLIAHQPKYDTTHAR